jgi:hypothetical protein
MDMPRCQLDESVKFQSFKSPVIHRHQILRRRGINARSRRKKQGARSKEEEGRNRKLEGGSRMEEARRWKLQVAMKPG